MVYSLLPTLLSTVSFSLLVNPFLYRFFWTLYISFSSFSSKFFAIWMLATRKGLFINHALIYRSVDFIHPWVLIPAQDCLIFFFSTRLLKDIWLLYLASLHGFPLQVAFADGASSEVEPFLRDASTASESARIHGTVANVDPTSAGCHQF